jgi:hypothetical protein
MLDHNVAPVLPFIARGRVCPISGNGHRGGGPCGSPPCQRAPRIPRVRQKYAKGVGCSRAYVAGVRSFDDIMGAQAR